MPYVSSSAISRIEYDAATRRLDVWFTSGGDAYSHYRVPEAVYRAFLAAAPKGSYYADHVKPHYGAR
ncbi:KTSC domain-containing protein [Roseomonas indoligenes]|uniref:KTSC domain-containing protein n=1 Tax=Roseomonas indoligenes TaxID=2820811 RepID=A0A940N2W8_9PROT|nr:KTSC domain-containing protein [Pararoseomonas indoligenes]MBP0495594.1 KTSC domain-containing protein [Pararoseomonas indoligenes]